MREKLTQQLQVWHLLIGLIIAMGAPVVAAARWQAQTDLQIAAVNERLERHLSDSKGEAAVASEEIAKIRTDLAAAREDIARIRGLLEARSR